MMRDQIRVVLVNTSHPGNIGSAARAMKVMGLTRLVLVSPKEFPSEKAVFMSSGATDVVERAEVVETFAEAVGECQLVLGASARVRSLPWPVVSAKSAAEQVVGLVKAQPDAQVALVFGREASGLTNDELMQCHYHVHIEGNPEYSVLNLAMAVQIIAYEVYQRWLAVEGAEEMVEPMPLAPCRWDVELASQAELDYFIEHLGQVLAEKGFYDPENPKQILARLRRLFTRMQPDQREIRLLRGVLAGRLQDS